MVSLAERCEVNDASRRGGTFSFFSRRKTLEFEPDDSNELTDTSRPGSDRIFSVKDWG